ncbi:MFS transporter [Dactylosporangium sp. NPDC049525]|uniref:MFS transporter n=1 Tax=Dactylosporangium sp. NPDC049525 TaxID=3154730 RepID=UPI00343DE6B6
MTSSEGFAGAGPTGSPLREARFRRLWLARGVTSVGGAMAPIALTFGVLSVGTIGDLGVVLAAQTAANAGCSLLGGALADHLSRALLMVASDLLRCVTQALLGILFIVDRPAVWVVALLAAAHGAGSALNGPARTGLVKQLVDPDRLQRANSTLTASESVVSVVALAAAGVLVAAVGPGPALVIDAATFLASAALLAPLARGLGTAGSRPRVLRDLRAGLRYVRGTPWLPPSLALLGVFQFLFLGSVLVLGPVVIEQRGEPASSWATVMVCFTVGALAGSLLAGRLRPSRPLLVSFHAILLALPVLVLLAVSAPTWSIAVAHGVSGLVMGFGGVVWSTVLQRSVDDALLGRVYALDWLASAALRPAGLMLAGAAAAVLGPAAVLLGAAALLAAVVLLTANLPSVRSQRFQPPGPRAVPEPVPARATTKEST